MPKKLKINGKSSGKTSNKEEGPKADYLELASQDPNFHIGSSNFEFPNGDKYEGEFCAHTSGLVWRQGKGKYTTKDGQVYDGQWDGDKLVDNQDVYISYADGTTYTGTLMYNKYSGPGVYKINDSVSLISNFADNKPTGEITLIDPNGKVWHGFAEKNDSLLIPEHPFYRNIGKDQGKGRSKRKPTLSKKDSKASVSSSKKSDGSQARLKYSDLREQEQLTFAKSKKTPSGDMFSSEWYQDYVDYCNTYGGIINKVKAHGEESLTDEEGEWYKKYKEFEKRYTTALEKHNNKKLGVAQDINMFQLIHSEEYKAVPVFYPSEPDESLDCDSNCECVTQIH